MSEPISIFTYLSVIVVCSLLILYIFSDFSDRFHERLPRRVTWLDMSGGDVLLLLVKFFVDGFIEAGSYIGTVYSFPLLISKYVVGSSVLGNPYEFSSPFIPNAFIGLMLCIGFIYVFVTLLLRLPSVDEIPYTEDTVVSRLFGFHPLRLRIPIAIVLVSSIIFSVVYPIISAYEIGYIGASKEDLGVFGKALGYLHYANTLFYVLIGALASIIFALASIVLGAVMILPELLLETIFQFSINLNTSYFDEFTRMSRDTVLLLSMGIIYVTPVIGRVMVSRFKHVYMTMKDEMIN